MRLFRRFADRKHTIAFMSRHLLECAEVIEALRLENEQLLFRGNRLAEAIDNNDGTINAAWKLGDAMSAWMEYSERVNVE